LLVARPDRLGGEHHGLEPRPADLVDRQRRHGPRETGVNRRLAARRLAHPALEHVPHDHFFDCAVLDAGAAHGLANHEGTEPGGGKRGEAAEILADRGAAGGENDGGGAVGHPFKLTVSVSGCEPLPAASPRNQRWTALSACSLPPVPAPRPSPPRLRAAPPRPYTGFSVARRRGSGS